MLKKTFAFLLIIILLAGCSFPMVENTKEISLINDRLNSIERKLDDLSIKPQYLGQRYLSDIDGNGEITSLEFKKFINDSFKALLQKSDVNEDGALDFDEVAESYEDLQKVEEIKTADQNQDYTISNSEFLFYYMDIFSEKDFNKNGIYNLDDVFPFSNARGTLEEERDIFSKTVEEILEESDNLPIQPRGLGYSQCSSKYMRCDPSCTRCVALAAPGFSRGPWGGNGGSVKAVDPNCTCYPGSEGCDAYACDCFPFCDP